MEVTILLQFEVDLKKLRPIATEDEIQDLVRHYIAENVGNNLAEDKCVTLLGSSVAKVIDRTQQMNKNNGVV